MKAILGWLCDPYVHIVAVGLILIRLAMGFGGDASATASSDEQPRCSSCLRFHNGTDCNPTLIRVVEAPRAD